MENIIVLSGRLFVERYLLIQIFFKKVNRFKA